MIYRITCNIVTEGYTEPEVALLLAPELRGYLVSQDTPHSWRSLFEVQAETDAEALTTFKEIFARKIGENDLRISYADEEARAK